MNDEGQRRWRLALGRYSDKSLGGLNGQSAEMDRSLDFLYAREYTKRGAEFGKGPGSLDPTQMSAINWLGKSRGLFPESVFETLQNHALDKYELTELLNDPKTLENLEPNKNLLKALLSLQGRANPAVKQKLRDVSEQVIREIMERLRKEVERAFSGRRNRFRRSNIPSAANFDWRATMRQNLKSYDPERKKIIAEKLRFNSRERRRLPWTIVLCVDQSGSMTDSIIHAAVMAAILSGLPGVRVKMVLFDTSIIDVTDKLTDPLDTLLSVQLGGGTNIGAAVEYCEQLIDDPNRTVFALITDFCEGAYPRPLYAAIARLSEARVHMIGLPALDESGNNYTDERIAGQCAQLGMKIAMMTPDRLAIWLAEVMV